MYYNLIKRLIIKKQSHNTGIKLKKQQLYYFGKNKIKMMVLMNRDIVKSDIYKLTGHSNKFSNLDIFKSNLMRHKSERINNKIYD